MDESQCAGGPLSGLLDIQLLLVQAHPGPTADAKARLDLRIQFFTSRGFAVVDVNYAGSTGYGRGYRERLIGEWGVADVADCLDAARFCSRRGRWMGGGW